MNPYEEMSDLLRNWTPPAELARSTPRETQLTSSGVAMAVLAGLLLVGAVVAAVAIENVARQQAAEQQLLREQGVVTEARITRLWRDNDKSRQPMLAYEFRADGVVYNKRVKVPLAAWRKLAYGTPVAVLYVPSNPAISRPRDVERTPTPHWLAVAAGVFLAALGALLVVVLRRARDLLSEGKAAPAIVTGYSRAPHNQRVMNYQFPLYGGGIGKGVTGPTRTALPVGSTLNVIYNRENPRRNAPYPMEFVRLPGARKVF